MSYSVPADIQAKKEAEDLSSASRLVPSPGTMPIALLQRLFGASAGRHRTRLVANYAISSRAERTYARLVGNNRVAPNRIRRQRRAAGRIAEGVTALGARGQRGVD